MSSFQEINGIKSLLNVPPQLLICSTLKKNIFKYSHISPAPNKIYFKLLLLWISPILLWAATIQVTHFQPMLCSPTLSSFNKYSQIGPMPSILTSFMAEQLSFPLSLDSLLSNTDTLLKWKTINYSLVSS